MLELELFELPVGELELTFVGLAGTNGCTHCEITDHATYASYKLCHLWRTRKMLFMFGRGVAFAALFLNLHSDLFLTFQRTTDGTGALADGSKIPHG